jgi:hypothetical protein
MRLQYASDLHLERWPKTTYEEVLKPAAAPVLVLLGDICPLDSSHLQPFFEWCSEKWKTVIWIPGDLEVWYSGFARVGDAVAAMKKHVSPFRNVHVLYCEAMGSDDGAILLGCPLWRRPRDEVMLHVTGKIWAKSDPCPCPVDNGVFLYEYNKCRRWLQSYLSGCQKPVVVLGCYAPLPWLTEEEWIQEKTSSTNSPEMEILLRPPLVAWLYGHCHVPNTENYSWTGATGHTNTVLLTSNPSGYPSKDKNKNKMSEFKMDAVVRIDPSIYLDTSSA